MTDPLTFFFYLGEGKSVVSANACRVPVPVGAFLGASFVHASLIERDWWILVTYPKEKETARIHPSRGQ